MSGETLRINGALVVILWLLGSQRALADKLVECRGQATSGGRDAYTEKIETHVNDHGDLLKTSTRYVDPEGKLLATLDAEFSNGLNVPNHRFHDERSGYTFGVRRVDEKIVMYAQTKDKPEKTRALEKDFKNDRLMVAGPGLGPYLKAHLEDFKKKKSVPIVILIPGNLDTFNFEIVLAKEADDVSEFEINISSIFFKAFAPQIRLTYNSLSQLLTHYEGVSNVNNAEDKGQDVKIDYSCSHENSVNQKDGPASISEDAKAVKDD